MFAELLYWQLNEVSDENWSQNLPPSGDYQAVTLHNVPFKLDPGVRLGIIYDTPSGVWDTSLYYTYYQTSANDRAEGHVYSPYLGNFFANNANGSDFGPYYDNAKLDWDFAFHTIDLELARHFVIDNALNLRPFIGLKAAVIRQEIDSHWYGPNDSTGPINTFTTARERITNNFWGVGPSLGLDSTWRLYQSINKSLNIIASLSGAVMWGHWSFSDHYENDTPVSIKIKNSDINDAAPMGRGVLGLEWTMQYSEAALSIYLAYEAQVWLDQVQYYNYNMGKLDNLMSLQGGTLGVRLNY